MVYDAFPLPCLAYPSTKVPPKTAFGAIAIILGVIADS